MKYVIGTSETGKVIIDPFILADTRGLICASSGGGKSWLLRKIAELVASDIQTILIDPEGEFPTLREKLDLLIVAQNGDLQADVYSAGLLARKLAETGVSAVIDIYDLPGKADPWVKRRAFNAEFLGALMNLPKSSYHPMLIIIDEAHNFAQENPQDTDDKNLEEIFRRSGIRSRSAVRGLMSAGRKRGFGGILATQRVSKIDKDSIADVRNWFIGGTNLDNDQKRAGDILGIPSKQHSTLRDLDPGTFYSFGPCLGQKGIILFTSAPVETTHPKAGQRSTIAVPKASTQIQAIVEQFGDLPAEIQEEKNALEVLQSENNQLRRQLQELRVRRVEIVSPEPTVIEKQVPIIPDGQLDNLEALVRMYDHRLEGVEGWISDAREVKQSIGEMIQSIRDAVKRPMYGFGIDPGKPGGDQTVITRSHKVQGAKSDRIIMDDTRAFDGLSGPQERIIDAIAWMETIGIPNPNISIVALLSGYTNFRSKGFTNPVSSLNVRGFIRKPDAKTITLTEAGQSLARYPQQPTNTKELQAIVFDKLPGPETKIMTVLVEHGAPVSYHRADLANRCGYSNDRSKGFTNPLSRVKVWGLVEKDGPDQFIAADLLFMEQ